LPRDTAAGNVGGARAQVHQAGRRAVTLIPLGRLRRPAWIASAWLAATLAAAAAQLGPADFTDGFDVDLGDRSPWQFEQLLHGGEIEVVEDPTEPGNRIAAMRTGGKRGEVAKAALVHRFDPVTAGTLHMSARVRFPAGAPMDSVILMDLECASCGLDTNPGLRLYLRDRRLRVDRSKIGLEHALVPSVDLRLEPETWHRIDWFVRLGRAESGETWVLLDGTEVLRGSGPTMLTQAVMDQIADIEVREQIDRFQIGITANSNRGPAELMIDDVSLALE
jgi:hypothetical protein